MIKAILNAAIIFIVFFIAAKYFFLDIKSITLANLCTIISLLLVFIFNSIADSVTNSLKIRKKRFHNKYIKPMDDILIKIRHKYLDKFDTIITLKKNNPKDNNDIKDLISQYSMDFLSLSAKSKTINMKLDKHYLNKLLQHKNKRHITKKFKSNKKLSTILEEENNKIYKFEELDLSKDTNRQELENFINNTKIFIDKIEAHLNYINKIWF